MSGTDRSLGIVFGVLRGIVIVGLLVLLAGMSALPGAPWWSESLFLPHFVELAQEFGAYLPVDVQRELDFEPEAAARRRAGGLIPHGSGCDSLAAPHSVSSRAVGEFASRPERGLEPARPPAITPYGYDCDVRDRRNRRQG